MQYPDGHILSGHDFRSNMSTARDLEGEYATDVFTDEAVRTIRQHDARRPLFLYLSHLAVHAGNAGKLLEAPQDVVNKFRHIAEPNRRTYAGECINLKLANGICSSSVFGRCRISGCGWLSNVTPSARTGTQFDAYIFNRTGCNVSRLNMWHYNTGRRCVQKLRIDGA